MSVLPTGIGPTTGYQIARSLRFNSADSAYLSRTNSNSPTSSTKYTFSIWLKRSTLTTETGILCPDRQSSGSSVWDYFFFQSDDTLAYIYDGSNSFITTAVFRDVSAWYHIVLQYDSVATTIKCWVNNTLLGSGSVSASRTTMVNSTTRVQNIGRYNNVSASPGSYFSGYMTEIYMVDGQALTPSSFGQSDPNTGVWSPIKYTGTYGTNGFYLNFSDNSGTTATTLGKDSSGNGNNWTPNNFSVTAGVGNDSLVDTPTSYGSDTGAGGEVRGNYATLNPLATNGGTFSNGNLEYVGPSAWRASPSTILLPSTGKWYFEGTLKASPLGPASFNNSYAFIGLIAPSAIAGWTWNSGTSFEVSDTGYYANYSTGATGSFTTPTSGTVLGLAVNRDTNQITVYRDGVAVVSNATLGITSGADLYAFYGSYDSSYGQMALNCGQRPFAYTAPSGYKALCTTNLPTTTIGATSTTQAGKYMNVVTYTGDSATSSAGTVARTITGVGFQPDLIWVKSRNNGGTWNNHSLTDAIRGNNLSLSTNATDAEINVATGFSNGGIGGPASDGFTIVSGTAGSTANLNSSSGTYVAWNWNAGGSNATNTSGSITSTVRANTTAGFSIVTYTGTGANATVGHGLGVAPSMFIVKQRSATGDWFVYHKFANASPQGGALFLNLTNAFTSNTGYWNNTAPTSSVLSIGSAGGLNANGVTQVAYCFAEIAGYSAFGSYTGNGSADGPFVYTGFRPRYVMVKRTDSTGYWAVFDSVRGSYNVIGPLIYPNDAQSEDNATYVDIVSNGFKFRTSTNSNLNTNTATYIYAAFAETAFKWALGR